MLKNKDYYYETKNIRSFSFSICGLTKYFIFFLAKGYIISDGFGQVAQHFSEAILKKVLAHLAVLKKNLDHKLIYIFI